MRSISRSMPLRAHRLQLKYSHPKMAAMFEDMESSHCISPCLCSRLKISSDMLYFNCFSFKDSEYPKIQSQTFL